MVEASKTLMKNELKQINWNKLFENQTSENCMSIFYNTIERLFDEMASVKCLTKKEVNFLK